jgi:endoglucanase
MNEVFTKRAMKLILITVLIMVKISVVAQPVVKHGALRVKGTGLVDKDNKPVLLRGMSFGWHNLWPRFYNAGAVKWLYEDWKCTVIRASMGIELNDSGYLKKPRWSVEHIKAVVDAAVKQGVYVIIDWHSHNIQLKEAREFFTEMAKTYGNYPNIIYEIFNEPDYESWPEVKTYSEELIRTIRAIDKDNIILVGSPHWDQDIHLPASDPIKGYDNLMYTVHFYAATHKQGLRDRTDEAIKKGLPVFISECAGMEASGDGPLNNEEWQRWIDWMESRGISWVVWSVSDKDETCSVLKKTAASEGNWKESDLKESGIKARQYLRSFALKEQLPRNAIQLNQIGFYPSAEKIGIVTSGADDSFVVIDVKTRAAVYKGMLGKPARSANSSLVVKTADFTSLVKPGEYTVNIAGLGNSPVFRISPSVHSALAISSLKGFYYQRVSMPLEEKYAGKWARPAGHPDTSVQLHPSAVNAKRPIGTIIKSAGGWYDAGDYNKYIVNSGITMGTLLSAYEDMPGYFDNLKTNIPESADAVPDILNEVLYNLRWMLTMQDPYDGGVYNKCTNANFDGMVMPGVTQLPRYVVQKGTAATLDFAAVMAQASRIFSAYTKQLPGLSDSCIKAAVFAWQWAEKNPALEYDQSAMNKLFDPDITTGGYGDRNFSDEWYWAAAELFVTTRDKLYYSRIAGHRSNFFSLPSWASTGMLGYYTLLRKRALLPGYCSDDIQLIKQYTVHFADSLLANRETSAFKTVMGGSRRDFVWGSSSVAANQGIALVNAMLISGDNKYMRGALANLDYLLGRNATGYCFVTGAGTKSVMHPHHRPSVADGIVDPVPGLLSGGPNPGRQDRCEYLFTEPETCFTDDDCSYASNEIAINWNAPLVYLVNALEALQYKAGYSKK